MNVWMERIKVLMGIETVYLLCVTCEYMGLDILTN